MKCPKCKMPLMKDIGHTFCPYCGYLDDGMQIRGSGHSEPSDLELYLGEKYDTIVRNTNWVTILILGPFYFWIRGFLLLGFLGEVLEILFWYLFTSLVNGVSSLFVPFLLISFFLTRFFCICFSNLICIFFYNLRIKKMKEKYPNDYLSRLKTNDNPTNPLGAILILIVILFIVGCYLVLSFI